MNPDDRKPCPACGGSGKSDDGPCFAAGRVRDV